MMVLSMLHLTILALIGSRIDAAFFRSAEIPTNASLATATQSCILPVHLTRRLKKLPVYETA
jgi:hypothetical protein